MNDNKMTYLLNEVNDSLELQCEYMIMLITSGRYKDASFKLDQHKGLIAGLEYNASKINDIANYLNNKE